jgi:hypothetical protein
VQNPVVRSLAREKANSRNMHPDVIAQTDKINEEGSKRNLTEQKADLVGVLRKRQRDFGRFEAIKYFKQDDNKRLTWSSPIFNDAKEGTFEHEVVMVDRVKKGGLILAIRVR